MGVRGDEIEDERCCYDLGRTILAYDDRARFIWRIVYAIENVETGRIKIGRTTTNPWRRIYELQANNDCELRMLAIGAEVQEARFTERLLHWRFVVHRVRGEWFDGSIKPDLVRAFHLARIGRYDQLRIEWEMANEELYRRDWWAADDLIGSARRWRENEGWNKRLRERLVAGGGA